MRRLGLPASVLLLSAFALGCAALPRPAPKSHEQDLVWAPDTGAQETEASPPLVLHDPWVDAPSEADATVVADAPPPPSAVHAATFDFAASASDWEAIARDTKATLAERAQAILEAASLARALGDVERMKRLQKLATSIALPPGTATKVAWLGATLDYVAWNATLPDLGDNHRHRVAATAAVRAFWEAQHAKRWAAPWVVEAAFAMTELLRAEPTERDTWLRRVGDAWAVVETPSASGVKMEREPSVIDHASMAALELLRQQVDAKLTGWVARCEASTPAALVGTPGPQGWTKGQYATDVALLSELDLQLGRASAAFKDATGFGAWYAVRGEIFATAARCMDTAARSGPTLNVSSRLSLLVLSGPPFPSVTPAFMIARRAEQEAEVARSIAVRDFAIAFAVSPERSDRIARNFLAAWATRDLFEGRLRSTIDPRTERSLDLATRYDPIGIPTPISAQPVVIAWLPDRP